MSTTKTLGQIAYETQQNLLGDCIIWHEATSLKRERWEAIANAVRDAVLAESKAASDVLHASLVTLSMEVTKMEALREECRQKDLIIQDLRNSIAPTTMNTKEQTRQQLITMSHDLPVLAAREIPENTVQAWGETLAGAVELLSPTSAQALEEWGKRLPDSSWVNCPICGGTDMNKVRDGEEDDFLITCTNCSCRSNGGDMDERLETLTRERDEAYNTNSILKGQREAALLRAESAEARVKVLEGELAELKSGFGHDNLTAALHALEAAGMGAPGKPNTLRAMVEECISKLSTWIPVSTPPTEGDATERNQVAWLQRSGSVMTGPWNMSDKAKDFWGVVGWLPLPPSTQTEDETERKAFEAYAKGQLMDVVTVGLGPLRQYRTETAQAAWLAWQAARQSPTKEASQS